MDLVTRPSLDVTSTSAEAGGASGSAKALIKGLALVDLVTEHGDPLRLTDLVAASGLPRPTTLRLLEVLCRSGALQVDGNGHYAPGPRLAVWGHAFLGQLDVRDQARDLMRDLVVRSGETCFLAVLDGDRVLYVAVDPSPHAVRPAARVGDRNPLHCTGMGKALLAGMEPGRAEVVVTGPLERRTPNTITDPARLRAELDLIRERGYSIDDIENEDGVRCVAASVRDHTGEVVAGLSVSAPAYRFSGDDVTALAPAVTRAAQTLSARLGHRPSSLTDIETYRTA